MGTDGPKPLKIKLGDVKGAIALAHHQVSDVEFFTNAPDGIAFSNGFVRVSAAGTVIEPHSPDHRARFAYPFPYDPVIAAPKRWLKFLYGIFRDDADREERVMLVHEFFGGALVGVSTRYDKAIMMQGQGDDGKSTLLDIFRAAMPRDTCSAVPPHKLSGYGGECDYFRASIVGKLVNIVSELPESDLLESTGFKAMVSGDVVGARVPCKPAFSFHPVAAHIFAANQLPSVGDMTLGFWRRIIMLPFTRSFDGDPDRDPNIAAEIIKHELGAIVAMMLAGAVRLMAQSSYTIPASHGSAMRAWQLASDPVRQWVGECTKPCDSDVGETSTHLYGSYKDWSVRNGHKTMAKNTFGKRLNLAGFKSKHSRTGEKYPLRRVLGDDVP
jgi:putative DNA primase/helicase